MGHVTLDRDDILGHVVTQFSVNTREEIDQQPTAVTLDHESPRAMLIRDVSPMPQGAALDSTVASSTITDQLRVRTEEDGNAVRLGQLNTAYHREDTGNPGIQAVNKEDTFEQIVGALTVAPYIEYRATGPSGDFQTVPTGEMFLSYYVVEVPWELNHKLYQMVDDADTFQVNYMTATVDAPGFDL